MLIGNNPPRGKIKPGCQLANYRVSKNATPARYREEQIPSPDGVSGHRKQMPNGVRLLVIVKMPEHKWGLLYIF
jgi:hypothetical protein